MHTKKTIVMRQAALVSTCCVSLISLELHPVYCYVYLLDVSAQRFSICSLPKHLDSLELLLSTQLPKLFSPVTDLLW